MRLFGRSLRVVVSTIQIEGLRVAFDIVKTIEPEPNTCVLSIYNLNETRRGQLSTLATNKILIPVAVEAGYVEGPTEQLYLGAARRVYSRYDGADIVTTIESGDGEKAMRDAKIQKTIPKGAPISQAVKEIVKALQAEGLSPGNVEKAIQGIKINGRTSFPSGSILSGPAAGQLTGLLKSAGLTWSVQNGQIQILTDALASSGQVLLLSPKTGLISSPEIDSEGILSATSLIIPGLRPGARIYVDAVFVKGNFRLESVQYAGDTHSDSWYAELRGKPL